MAIDLTYYVVTLAVARRTGDMQNIYKTDDGRYVMDSRQLSRIRLASREYLTGLDGIEQVSREEAMTLIARGGYRTDAQEDRSEDTLSAEDAGSSGAESAGTGSSSSDGIVEGEDTETKKEEE